MDENPQQNDATPQDPVNNDAPKSAPSGTSPESATSESAENKPTAGADVTPPAVGAKKKLPKKSSFVDFVICLVTAVAIALLLRSFIFQPFKIPTNSMHPTLVGNYAHGDRILVNLLTYKLSEPQRWDVFVFKCPDPKVEPDKADYIKRLVGLPGDILDVKNGDIYVHKKIARKPRQVQDGIWIKEYEDSFEKPFVEGAYNYWNFVGPDKWDYNSKDGTVVATSSHERTQVKYNRVINSENDLFPESNITNMVPFRYLRITKNTKVTCPFCKYSFAPSEWEIKRPEIGDDNKRDDFYLRCQNRNCGQCFSLDITPYDRQAKLLIYGKDRDKPIIDDKFGDITGLNDESSDRNNSSALASNADREIVGDIKSTLDFKFLEKDTITFTQLKIDNTQYTLYLSPDYPLNDITRNYLLISNGANTSKHKLNSDKILTTGKTIIASVETFDHSVNIVIDGAVVCQYTYDDDFDPNAKRYSENGVSFGIDNGKAAFNSWNIYKDIYYLSTGRAQHTIDLTDSSPDDKLRSHYFAMGDNSALSADSRTEWGGVPKENIIGKAILVLWPPKHVKMIR